MAVRLALWIPLAAALISAPRLVIGSAQGGSVLLADDWRFVFYLIAPPVFAVTVIYAASTYAAWLAGPVMLPRFARAAVEMNRIEPLPEVGLVRYATTLTGLARIRLALRTVAEATILLFLAVPLPAILLGYLFQAGTYRFWEAVIVALCAAVEVGWLAFLLYRFLSRTRPG